MSFLGVNKHLTRTRIVARRDTLQVWRDPIQGNAAKFILIAVEKAEAKYTNCARVRNNLLNNKIIILTLIDERTVFSSAN